jgi:hypothetical protein
MKAFFRKYGRRIIWFLVFGAFVLVFMPRQTDYYLRSDSDGFSARVYLYLVWVAVGLYALALVWAIIKLRRPGPIFQNALVVAFFLFCSYMIFRQCFTAVGLYVNRWSDRGVVTRSYVAGYLVGETKSEHSLSLFELPSRSYIGEKELVRQAYHSIVKDGDTVYLELKKGLFGVAYFDSLAVRR